MAEFQPGDRVMEFSGTPSQQVGTVITLAPMSDRPGLFPIVCWDVGYISFASPERGLKNLFPGQQLSLFGGGEYA